MKMMMHNMMTLGMQAPHKSLNDVYTIAAYWIMTQPSSRPMSGTMFTTVCMEKPDRKSSGNRKSGDRKRGGDISKVTCLW